MKKCMKWSDRWRRLNGMQDGGGRCFMMPRWKRRRVDGGYIIIKVEDCESAGWRSGMKVEFTEILRMKR